MSNPVYNFNPFNLLNPLSLLESFLGIPQMPLISVVVLDMSKDLSDSVKDHGIEAVRDKLLPLLKQAI